VNDVAATAVAAEGAAGAEQPPSADDCLADETLDYVQHCQETYGCPGLIDFSEGHNGLPKATLQHPAGPSCEVYLHGAAVTSWRHADGREMLHLRESNTFDGSNPIT
jgi:glucose-6-phosphate 1-epimerase